MRSFETWFKEAKIYKRMMRYETLRFGYNAAMKEALLCEQSYKDDIKMIMNEEIHMNGYSLTVQELIDGKKEK